MKMEFKTRMTLRELATWNGMDIHMKLKLYHVYYVDEMNENRSHG